MERHTLIFRAGLDNAPNISADVGMTVTQVPILDEEGKLLYNISQTIDENQEQRFRVTENGADLLLVASAVYAADKRISRQTASQDGWSREIDIYLPVNRPDVWSPLRPMLENMLGFLTGDLWRFSFRTLTQPLVELAESHAELKEPTPSQLCLFSGGLDSYVGAIDLLQGAHNPVLISHSWGKTDAHHQTFCLDALKEHYGNNRIFQMRSRIGFGEKDLHITTDGEETERSRSFLFFSVAGAVASGLTQHAPTVVPENGLISLNIPLDPLRLGSYSTRTTHPYFIARFNELLTDLGIRTHLVNPYRFRTKGEMVRECQNPALLGATATNTMSCSSPTKGRWQKEKSGVHCGHCVPCLIRRAALAPSDSTEYNSGPLTGKTFSSIKAEGEHIRAFELAISRLNKKPEMSSILVQRSGPLSDHPGDLMKFADMYRRGMAEVEQLLQGVRTSPYV